MSDTTNKTDNAPAPEENGEKKKEDTAKSQDASGTEQNPAGEKFRSFTRKVTSSAEKIIGASYKTAKTAILNVKFKPQAGVKVLDKFLKFIRSILSEELFDKIAETSVKYGHMAISASQILVVLFGIRASIRTGNWRFTIYSLMGVLIFMVLQYTAHKFLNAGHSLINSSPSKLSSPAFLDCLALVMESTGLMILLYCLLQFNLADLMRGITAYVLCGAVAYVSLYPSAANVDFSSDIRAGEEAIGIMSFLMKAAVRISPLLFGIGSAVAAITLLLAILKGNLEAGTQALRLAGAAAVLPIAFYIVFAFYHLILDILRAILLIPGKKE